MYDSYDKVIASPKWKVRLDNLDNTLCLALEASLEKVKLHSQISKLWKQSLDPNIKVKRRNLFIIQEDTGIIPTRKSIRNKERLKIIRPVKPELD